MNSAVREVAAEVPELTEEIKHFFEKARKVSGFLDRLRSLIIWAKAGILSLAPGCRVVRRKYAGGDWQEREATGWNHTLTVATFSRV